MEGTPPPTAPQRGDVAPGSVVKEAVPQSPQTTPIMPGMGNKGTQVTPTSPRGRVSYYSRAANFQRK